MTSQAPVKTRGTFWRPDQPEPELYGELTYDQASGANLELHGTFGEPLPGEPRTIWGTTITGAPMTLFDAYFDGQTTVGNTASTTCRYMSYLAAIGNHYRATEEILARHARVAIEGLSHWARVPAGINATTEENGTSVIQFRQPRPFPLGTHDDITIAIESTVQEDWTFGRILIQYANLLTLTATTDKTFEKLNSIIGALQQFLALCTGTAHNLTGISLSLAPSPQPSVPMPARTVEIIQAHSIPSTTSSRRPPGAHLSSLGPDPGQYVTAFLQKHEALKPVCDLWHTTIVNPYLYLEHQFLSLAYAVEAGHGKLIRGEYMPKPEYRKNVYPILVSAIPSDLPEEFRDSLANRIKYHNNFELARRVRDVSERVTEIATPLGATSKDFASRIAAVRNKLAHDGTLPKGVSWDDMARMSDQLSIILRAVLLKEAGVPDDRVRTMLLTNQAHLTT